MNTDAQCGGANDPDEQTDVSRREFLAGAISVPILSQIDTHMDTSTTPDDETDTNQRAAQAPYHPTSITTSLSEEWELIIKPNGFVQDIEWTAESPLYAGNEFLDGDHWSAVERDADEWFVLVDVEVWSEKEGFFTSSPPVETADLPSADQFRLGWTYPEVGSAPVLRRDSGMVEGGSYRSPQLRRGEYWTGETAIGNRSTRIAFRLPRSAKMPTFAFTGEPQLEISFLQEGGFDR